MGGNTARKIVQVVEKLSQERRWKEVVVDVDPMRTN